MTPTEINKKCHEKLGLHWHEWVKKRGSYKDIYGSMRSNKNQHFYCRDCGKMKRKGKTDNHDFYNDPVALLRELEKWDKWGEFLMDVGSDAIRKNVVSTRSDVLSGYVIVFGVPVIETRYITTPDLLATKLAEWKG